jgi:hypothetical protein
MPFFFSVEHVFLQCGFFLTFPRESHRAEHKEDSITRNLEYNSNQY